MTTPPSSSAKPSAQRSVALSASQGSPALGGCVPPPHFLSRASSAPLYEVDRFRFSDVCNTLVRDSADVFAPLVSQMNSSALTGGGAYFFTSIRPSAGRKTVLVTVARLLAAAGRKVLMVDASFAEPRLAHRLKLLPRAGWEEVLLRGAAPLHVVIESLADKMALLPLREALEVVHGQNLAAAVARSLCALRASYEVLLVDGGLLDAGWLSVLPAGRLTAAVLVTDPSATPAIGVDAAAEVLTAAGISPWHLVENFQVSPAA